MKRSRTDEGMTWRVAVIPVKLAGASYRHAHQACHQAALIWNNLVAAVRDYWTANESDPSVKELREAMYSFGPELLQGLHAHTKQAIVDDLLDAIQTYRSNRDNGDADSKAPHREKNYRPLEFTHGYGWRETVDGRLALSFGRGRDRIILPMPEVNDPRTGDAVLPSQWGSMQLCWDINAREWSLHISVPTGRPAVGDPQRIAAIDEGIINPMAVAVETEDAYEVLVVNGRNARSVKHYRNTRISQLQEAISRCVEGSKRWRRLDAKRKKLEARANKALRNENHQVTRKVADFVQQHEAGQIIAGDVRGIERETRKKEEKRCRSNRNQRRRLSQWARGKQEDLLEHKTGLEVQHIDEARSSKTCPACLTRNRVNGRGYHCHACGFTCNRDAVGALNILMKALHGDYTPIDMNKPIHVKYLRATPLYGKRQHGVKPGTGACRHDSRMQSSGSR